jgi:uncharacterized iron-regulated membrane protein
MYAEQVPQSDDIPRRRAQHGTPEQPATRGGNRMHGLAVQVLASGGHGGRRIVLLVLLVIVVAAIAGLIIWSRRRARRNRGQS